MSRVLTVTLNPAIDVRYNVENFRLGNVNRTQGIEKNAGGKGINITGANVKTENNGTIEVNGGASGVVVSNDSASFVNNETGKIIATGTNSKGIDITKGQAINKGTIVVGKDLETGKITSQTIGANVNGGSFENKKSIEVYGENSKGIAVYKGTATNKGTIVAQEKSAAVYLANANGSFINEENGTIIADGKGSKAIQFGEGAKNAINKGTIIAQNSADGIFLSADKIDFTNGETGKISAIGTGSKAINLNNKDAKATNNGIIEVSGGATAVENKGTFINNKTMDIFYLYM